MRTNVIKIAISLSLLLILTLPTFSWAQLLQNRTLSSKSNSDVELYRERIQRFLVKSDNLFRQGNYIEALNQLDLAVEATPQNPEVYLHRAKLRYRLGMENEAKQDIALVSTINPIATDLFGINGPKAQLDLLAFYPEELYLELAWSDQLKVYDTVVLDWYEAMTEAETADPYPSEMAANYLTIIQEAITQKNWILASKELELLASINPNESLVYDLKGLIVAGKGNPEEAASYFRTAIQLDPNNAIGWYHLGQVQRMYNNEAVALTSINKAIQLRPTLDVAYFERALLHKELGDLEAALTDYSTLIQYEGGNNLPILFNRALTYKKLGRFTDAMNDLDYIIQNNPTTALAYKVRGNIHLLTRYYNNAIYDFTKAIEKDGELAEAYFNRAIAHLLNNNIAPACVDFEKSAAKGYERGEEKQLYFCSN